MKAMGIIILAVGFFVVVFTLVTGIVMVLLGAIGNRFDVEAFKLLSFWNVALITIIFGLIRWVAGNN